MSNLLQVTRFSKAQMPKSKVPLAIECEVSPETAPYLVTTSKGLAWVATPTESVVRAAVRAKTHPDHFFKDIVETVHSTGLEMGWGNVLPLSRKGMEAAIQHVEGYGFDDLEILVPTVANEQDREVIGTSSKFDYPTKTCSWLPGDLAVVVPKDRGFVGFVYRVTHSDIVGVVHNVARGLAIVSDRLPVGEFADEEDVG